MQNEISGSFITLNPCVEGKKRNKGNVVVVSPHPDDDVIGAGGEMYLLSEKGYSLFSLYVTHGASGIAGESQINIRQKEALEALRVVNASAGIFLNYSSSGIKKALKDMIKVFSFLKPAAVYLPSPFERHPTHRNVTKLTINSLKKNSSINTKLWGYSVWGSISGLSGTKVVDISRVVSLKRKAIRKHKSQLLIKSYDEAVLARNRYEGICCETHKNKSFSFAETFLDMTELICSHPPSLSSFIKKKVEIFFE